MILDPRSAAIPLHSIPDDAWIPIATAHVLVSVGKSTVYRWYADDRIAGREFAVNTGGTTLHVRAGDVRELYERLSTRRHAGRRRRAQ